MIAVAHDACNAAHGKRKGPMGTDLKARLGGLACLLLAAAFGAWGIWQPLSRAAAGDPTVSYSVKVFVLVPMAAVFGLFFVIFGDRIPYRNAERQSLTPAGWALMGVATVAAGVGFWWFKAQFEALGYGV
jgi:hypothetical protein